MLVYFAELGVYFVELCIWRQIAGDRHYGIFDRYARMNSEIWGNGGRGGKLPGLLSEDDNDQPN